MGTHKKGEGGLGSLKIISWRPIYGWRAASPNYSGRGGSGVVYTRPLVSVVAPSEAATDFPGLRISKGALVFKLVLEDWRERKALYYSPPPN